MEKKLRYERALKRQNIGTRGSVNKVAQSSDVIVKRLEDGSVEGIKLQYKPRYSRNEPNMSIDKLKELIDWTPMADLLRGEKHD